MLRRSALIAAFAATSGIAALLVNNPARAKRARSESRRSVIEAFVQQGEPLTRKGAKRHLFGASVALSGNGETALISEEGEDAVWVFIRSGARWTEQAKLTSPNGQADRAFGEQVALSGNGDTALISDPAPAIGVIEGAHEFPCGYTPEELEYSEAVAWVFTRSRSRWSAVSRLVPAEESQLERSDFDFPIALSANGNTALIGAPYHGHFRGAVWAFSRSGASWSHAEELSSGTEVGEEGFGQSLALSANGAIALIGSPGNHGFALEAGSARIFIHSGSGWREDQELTGTGEAAPDGGFGHSVALSGNGRTALVTGDAENRGAVWVFARAGSVWKPDGTLTRAGAKNLYELGAGAIVKISADGDTALVGGERGAAWVFRHSGSAFSEGERLSGGEGDFGKSLALSRHGDTALVGEPVERVAPGISCLGHGAPRDPAYRAEDIVGDPRHRAVATDSTPEESGRVWVFRQTGRRLKPSHRPRSGPPR